MERLTKPKARVNRVTDDRGDYTDQRAVEFAQRLRQTRERQGLKQTQLAAAAGLSAAAISQLENGERRPNFTTLVGLARALSTTPDGLLGVSGKETGEPELKALFRNLEGLSASDVTAVQGFVSYLEQRKSEEDG